MKVFLSYGHDANAPLVEDLRRDLVAAGYEPWHDARAASTRPRMTPASASISGFRDNL